MHEPSTLNPAPRPLRYLFVHQNFPGQFRHTAPALAAMGHQVIALRVQGNAQEPAQQWQGIKVLSYAISGKNVKGLHPWLTDIETKTLRATSCMKACLQLQRAGWNPDVIVAHPGWGEALFVKNVWPKAKLGLYAEMYYQRDGADTGFDPEFTAQDPLQQACQLQMKNLNHLAHLTLADGLLSPTRWQAKTYPLPWRDSITVVHDGIDTDELQPDPQVRFALPAANTVLSKEDEVITFVARHLEPYRGFHIFVRGLPALLKARPRAQILIAGEDSKGYGPMPPTGSWRQLMMAEIAHELTPQDSARLHFLGRLDRSTFTRLLQISTVHVYLSYPFVLSWSLLEAMSVGCAIVASDTAPVREVITDQREGCLVDFFNAQALVRRIDALANDASQRRLLGQRARQRAVGEYDLKGRCLQGQLNWIKQLHPAS